MIRFLNLDHVRLSENGRVIATICCNAVEIYTRPHKKKGGRILMYDLTDDDGVLVPEPRVFARMDDLRGLVVTDRTMELSTPHEYPMVVTSQNGLTIELKPPVDQAIIPDPLASSSTMSADQRQRLVMAITTWERRVYDIRVPKIKEAVETTLRSMRASLSKLEKSQT